MGALALTGRSESTVYVRAFLGPQISYPALMSNIGVSATARSSVETLRFRRRPIGAG
ncbi:protein of unknown function [Methylocaldum szegediense]|uniref:Uncharacterized protein n=1 Tax=Methylocaldum szegediense TaxID=73780 RepID=A0ABM9I3C1_9GAMM|nr:protein of unknown function [Methylocaldum szegediense]